MLFWHKLALRLGMSVAEAQERIDSDEYTRWIAYDRMSPISDDRHDFLFANLCSLIFNIKRTKNSRPRRAKDFMPVWSVEATRQSPEEILRRLQQSAKLHNIPIIEADSVPPSEG